MNTLAEEFIRNRAAEPCQGYAHRRRDLTCEDAPKGSKWSLSPCATCRSRSWVERADALSSSPGEGDHG